MRNVRLVDLAALHAPLRDQMLAAIAKVVDTQQFILGEEMALLEEDVARYSGMRRGVACASGSDALFLALLALGIGPGDVVLTTPFTFFATAGAISRAGAEPVFVDIDARTYNMDPSCLAAELERQPRAKAIIPVHLYGGSADMDPILDLANRFGCLVIEDGAQSIGAKYKGRPTQGLGALGCLSFFPSKNLGGMGDGGMVLTNDADLANRVAALRVHGSSQKYYHDLVGINSRMDTIQAAVLRVKLRHLDDWTAARARNAEVYSRLLADVPGVVLPVAAPYQTRHVWNQFVIRTSRRDEMKSYLQANGIGTEVYYPLPLHRQKCYAFLGYTPGSFPEAERACEEVLALPVHPQLTGEDLEYVAGKIRSFHSHPQRHR